MPREGEGKGVFMCEVDTKGGRDVRAPSVVEGDEKDGERGVTADVVVIRGKERSWTSGSSSKLRESVPP